MSTKEAVHQGLVRRRWNEVRGGKMRQSFQMRNITVTSQMWKADETLVAEEMKSNSYFHTSATLKRF